MMRLASCPGVLRSTNVAHAQRRARRSRPWRVALLVLAGCASCRSGGGDLTCVPAPSIASSPPASATVGQQYTYTVRASYVCGMFSLCGDIVAVELPPGANADARSVAWTPSVDQSGGDFHFTIATPKDDCGDQATQSWTVHVNPSPLAGQARGF